MIPVTGFVRNSALQAISGPDWLTKMDVAILPPLSDFGDFTLADSTPAVQKRVRTHVITGFLGTGKTTLIMHLLKQKPENEKWAVLVNEFGEIGVDGAILQTRAQDGSGVAIREVPGGCLCCAAGLPFQIGMNWLIAREKPDVLLIEPTGLGHPAELLDSLRGEAYANVLSLGATLTLVDPRHLSKPKYRQHAIYADQLTVADLLVANKSDLATESDWIAFDALVNELNQQRVDNGHPALTEARIRHGELDIVLLQRSAVSMKEAGAAESDTNNVISAAPPALISNPGTSPVGSLQPNAASSLSMVLDLTNPVKRGDDQDYHMIDNLADGMLSVGWLIRPEWIFSLAAIRAWLGGLEVERAKAVLNTDEGRRIFNLREGMLTEMDGGDQLAEDSRLELIVLAADIDGSMDDAKRTFLDGWRAALV